LGVGTKVGEITAAAAPRIEDALPERECEVARSLRARPSGAEALSTVVRLVRASVIPNAILTIASVAADDAR
jgi:hypothetical protein